MNRILASLLRTTRAQSSARREKFRPIFDELGGKIRSSYRPDLERLEDRVVPALIASQVLPLMNPTVTTTTVSVIAAANAGQVITLTATIGGGATTGVVDFTVTGSNGTVLGTAVGAVNSSGVAQAPFTLPDGTAPGTYTVTAVYSGSGSTGSSSFIVVDDCAEGDGTEELLGTAATFAVLAGSTVTNTGPTVIFGDVGVFPGVAGTREVTGLLAAQVTGTVYANTPPGFNDDQAVPQAAQEDLTDAYDNLSSRTPTSILTGVDLGGLTLTPGVYFFGSSAQLTGTLILNALGDPDSVFVFQTVSTLTTASNSSVVMINGGLHDNIYWQVGSSATLGTNTTFVGNIVALTSITLNTGATIDCGRALARNGAVTLDNNIVSRPEFAASPVAPANAAFAPAGAAATATAGVYDSSSATWYLRNSNSAGAPDFTPFAYGFGGTVPVVGDWNGDGSATVGIYAPSTATWYLNNNNAAGAPSFTPFAYGFAGVIPVVGDWDSDGDKTVGVYDPASATWYLNNNNGAGAPSFAPFAYGFAGGIPVVGDWDGNGSDTIGVYNPANATWYLRNSNDAGAPDITPFSYGFGTKPVVGDWNGDGQDTIGIWNVNTAQWYLRDSNDSGVPSLSVFAYGFGAHPLVGAWSFSNAPLHASSMGPGAAALLDDAALQTTAAAALDRLAAAGADAGLRAFLASTRFEIQQLPGTLLGMAWRDSGKVLIDADAAGYGWFIDDTPLDDAEFAAGYGKGLAAGRMDLLTAVLHELGHASGLGHGAGIMGESLMVGTRLLDSLDVLVGSGH